MCAVAVCQDLIIEAWPVWIARMSFSDFLSGRFRSSPGNRPPDLKTYRSATEWRFHDFDCRFPRKSAEISELNGGRNARFAREIGT
jgi:hypothetical protein